MSAAPTWRSTSSPMSADAKRSGCAPTSIGAPIDVGAQPDRFASADIGDDVERHVGAADIALRTAFEQKPLQPQFAGKIADPRALQRGDGAIGLAVHQIDHGETRSDLRSRRAFEAVVDLI